MKELSACPLCRSVLPAGSTSCAECGAELKPYLELNQRAEDYLSFARDLISRGELEQAQVICDGLPLLDSAYQTETQALQIRLLLVQDQLTDASAALLKLPESSESAALRTMLTQRQAARLAGQELYNSALSLVKQGDTRLAAQLLGEAVAAQPHDSAIWLLKLKVDLKLRRYAQCYTDANALDRLGARPREYTHIEQLLPPISQA